jgi:hypothetical protein
MRPGDPGPGPWLHLLPFCALLLDLLSQAKLKIMFRAALLHCRSPGALESRVYHDSEPIEPAPPQKKNSYNVNLICKHYNHLTIL